MICCFCQAEYIEPGSRLEKIRSKFAKKLLGISVKKRFGGKHNGPGPLLKKYSVQLMKNKDKSKSAVNDRQQLLLYEINPVKYPGLECAGNSCRYMDLFVDINDIAAVTDCRINLSVIKRLIP